MRDIMATIVHFMDVVARVDPVALEPAITEDILELLFAVRVSCYLNADQALLDIGTCVWRGCFVLWPCFTPGMVRGH